MYQYIVFLIKFCVCRIDTPMLPRSSLLFNPSSLHSGQKNLAEPQGPCDSNMALVGGLNPSEKY